MQLSFKVWPTDQGISVVWELVRNAELWPQCWTYLIRIRMLVRSPRTPVGHVCVPPCARHWRGHRVGRCTSPWYFLLARRQELQSLLPGYPTISRVRSSFLCLSPKALGD